MQRKIKVLHIVEDLHTGGLEKVIYALVTGMDREKFDSSVWCLSRGGEIADDLTRAGFPPLIFTMKARPTPGFIIKLAWKMAREGVDVVHTHGYTATTVGRTAAIIAGVPGIIAHMHSTYYNFTRRQRIIDRILSWFTARIVCCSKAVREFVIREEKIQPRKTQVIYNGVLVPPNNTAGQQLRAELGIPDGVKVIGCVASLTHPKGQRYLIEVAADIIKRGRRMKVILVGDGPERDPLKKLAQELGISDSIIFCGIVHNVWPYLDLMDIFVFPSMEREGLGIALIEAIAVSRCVVASDLGGIPEVVTNGKTGILVKPEDPIALEAAIEWIFANPEKSRAMALAGSQDAAIRFNYADMLKAFGELYQQVAFPRGRIG